MNRPFLARLAAVVLLSVTVNACSKPLCEDAVVGKAAEGLEIKVGKGELKRIGGEFFGFNLESAEFQLSLWDEKSQQVRPEVVRELAPFKGAVYRFPGGTTANYYPWAKGTGAVAKREPVRIVDWTELPRIAFGLDEYLDFVDQVGGQAWYVLNLQGGLGEPAELDALTGQAHELVRYVGRRNQPVLRWELGNELDRAQDMWTSAKYVVHAQAVLQAVRSADPDARFVGMMADYDAQKSRGITSSQYNQAVATALKDAGVDEYEQHLYYDGPPDGPNLPNRLRQLCRSIQDARDAGVPQRKLAFWVTEHGRWPQARPGEKWKLSWKKTADVGAAIGVADLLIALTQMAEVRGSALHSLHGTNGPWPLFHKSASSSDGTLVPSVTLHAYSLLNRSMLPVVLPSRSSSPARTGYEGGYDARGAVLTTPERDRFSVWTVNRDTSELTVTLRVAELAGRKVSADLEYIAAKDSEANNYEKADTVVPQRASRTLSFDSAGTATYLVPALSVAALRMTPTAP